MNLFQQESVLACTCKEIPTITIPRQRDLSLIAVIKYHTLIFKKKMMLNSLWAKGNA